jgi:hypothetical protein
MGKKRRAIARPGKFGKKFKNQPYVKPKEVVVKEPVVVPEVAAKEVAVPKPVVPAPVRVTPVRKPKATKKVLGNRKKTVKKEE